jgi:hypothetical protein
MDAIGRIIARREVFTQFYNRRFSTVQMKKMNRQVARNTKKIVLNLGGLAVENISTYSMEFCVR